MVVTSQNVVAFSEYMNFIGQKTTHIMDCPRRMNDPCSQGLQGSQEYILGGEGRGPGGYDGDGN